MKAGDLVKLHDSKRRNGLKSGKIGLVVSFDHYNNPVLKIEGRLVKFHYTQIGEVISEAK